MFRYIVMHDSSVPEMQGYADGNLTWQAAFEAKYAWMSVAYKEASRRENFDPNMTIQEASGRWGCDSVGMLQQYCEDSGASLPKTVLDVGCSTGYSSRQLRQMFPDLSITGIDASPYFLAVAETEERCDTTTFFKPLNFVCEQVSTALLWQPLSKRSISGCSLAAVTVPLQLAQG